MAFLIYRLGFGLLLGLVLLGCSSSNDVDPDLLLEDEIPDVSSEPIVDADGFTRTVGGYFLEGNNGVFQICFRLLEQDGDVLCVDGRASLSGDDYVELDRTGIEVVEEAGITRSTNQVWLWQKQDSGEGGLLLKVRPVADGEVLP